MSAGLNPGMSAGAGWPGGPVQERAEVVTVRREGVYHVLTLAAPRAPAAARPGQFVALAVGGQDTPMLARRAFSIHRAEPGRYGGTAEVVVAVHGPGTAWLSRRGQCDRIDLVGPLGRPFALPWEPVSCALVGGGYGSAPLFWLAEGLRERGCAVHFVLGAATEQRLFGALGAKRMGDTAAITTEDGSLGERGLVTDVLPAVLERSGVEVVYACGPMPMLGAVSRVAAAGAAHCQVAVEEAMACGIGVCMTCVVPVVGEDGTTRMLRSCVDGPVFRGDRVRWEAVGTVPGDTFGADAMREPIGEEVGG